MLNKHMVPGEYLTEANTWPWGMSAGEDKFGVFIMFESWVSGMQFIMYKNGNGSYISDPSKPHRERAINISGK
jgi:hypothetical protein